MSLKIMTKALTLTTLPLAFVAVSVFAEDKMSTTDTHKTETNYACWKDNKKTSSTDEAACKAEGGTWHEEKSHTYEHKKK